MNEDTAFAVAVIAIFATAGFICWLHARYPRSSGERESSVYKWTTITQAQPRYRDIVGRARRPKPVPPVRPAQPNRRKKKKARR